MRNARPYIRSFSPNAKRSCVINGWSRRKRVRISALNAPCSTGFASIASTGGIHAKPSDLTLSQTPAATGVFFAPSRHFPDRYILIVIIVVVVATTNPSCFSNRHPITRTSGRHREQGRLHPLTAHSLQDFIVSQTKTMNPKKAAPEERLLKSLDQTLTWSSSARGAACDDEETDCTSSSRYGLAASSCRVWTCNGTPACLQRGLRCIQG